MATSAEPRRGLYYGWYIVPVLLLFPFLLYGMYVVGVGPSVTPLSAEFGWSRTFISAGYSFGAAVAAFVAPFLGYAVDRFGPRPMLLLGAIVMGLGAWVCSFDNGSGIFWYAGWAIMVALAPMWAGYPNLNKISSTWFFKRRGLVIGLVAASGGLCYMMTTVHVLLIDSLGWRANWQILGTTMAVFGIIGYLVVRNRPEEKGYRIDGVVMTPEERAEYARTRGRPAPPTPTAAAARPRTAAEAEYSFTWLQAIRIPALWFICIAGLIAGIALNVQTTQQVPFLEGMGIPRLVAAAVLGTMGLLGIPFRIAVGLLMDRFGRESCRYWYALAFGLETVGMIILIYVTGIELMWVFALVFGAGQGMSVSAPVAMMAFYFGPGAYGTVYGIRMAIIRIGTVVGPVFAAYVYDTTGSYEFAFVVVAVLVAIAGLILLLPWAAPPKVPIGAAGSR